MKTTQPLRKAPFSTFLGNKQFYLSVLAIAIPIALQNAVSNFVGLLDNIMIGQIGTEQMTGVSIVNQLHSVYYLCVFGVVSGAGLFTAQFYGKRNMSGVCQTIRFKLICTLLLCAGTATLLLTCQEPLIRMYLGNESQSVNPELTLYYAKEYLSVILFSLVPTALSQVYSSTLRECGSPVLPMVGSTSAVCINGLLNYILIFGKLGIPAMGVRGAALATVISRFSELAIVFVWAHIHIAKYPFLKGLYRPAKIDGSLAKKILVTGFPVFADISLWSVAQTLLLRCYSERGLAGISALNISNTFNDTASVLCMSFGSALAIILGQLLGAGKQKEAKETAPKLITLALLSGIATGLVVFSCSFFFPNIYNTTEEVKGLATVLMKIVAVFVPVHAYANATYYTLRSGGKTIVTFIFNSGYAWLGSLSIVFCMTRFTGLSLPMVYLCYDAVEFTKCILGTILVRKGTWAITLTENSENSVSGEHL